MKVDMNTLTSPQKLVFELRAEMQRAVTQLSLGLEMDDSPAALLAVVEEVESRLGSASRNARQVVAKEPTLEEEDDLPW